MVSATRWRRTSGWRRWKRFFLRSLSDTVNSSESRLDTYLKLRGKVVPYAEARKYVAPKLGQVAKAREDTDDPMDVGGFGQPKGRSTPKGKEKEPHWQSERNRKRWCDIIRTSEYAESSRSMLELREDRSSIKRLLGEATAATKSRTIELFWKE